MGFRTPSRSFRLAGTDPAVTDVAVVTASLAVTAADLAALAPASFPIVAAGSPGTGTGTSAAFTLDNALASSGSVDSWVAPYAFTIKSVRTFAQGTVPSSGDIQFQVTVDGTPTNLVDHVFPATTASAASLAIAVAAGSLVKIQAVKTSVVGTASNMLVALDCRR